VNGLVRWTEPWWWALVDTVAHILDRVRLIPGRLRGWVCDRYDLALGVTRDELRRST